MECGPIIGRRSRRNAAFCTPSRIPWPEQKRLHTQHLSTLIAMAITIKTKSAPPAPPAGVDELLSPKEIQGWLKTSRPSFYRWIKMGQFPKHDLIAGCKPRWKKSTVQAWIDSKGTQTVT
jgi:predicted DNA-binding transcriptional regulator AlpA